MRLDVICGTARSGEKEGLIDNKHWPPLQHATTITPPRAILSRHNCIQDSQLDMPAIQHPVKINVDLGEGYGNFKCGPDDELIPLIDHANVACGFHAGSILSYAFFIASLIGTVTR